MGGCGQAGDRLDRRTVVHLTSDPRDRGTTSVARWANGHPRADTTGAAARNERSGQPQPLETSRTQYIKPLGGGWKTNLLIFKPRHRVRIYRGHSGGKTPHAA